MSSLLREVLAEYRAYEQLRDMFLENQALELLKRSDGNPVEFVIVHGPRTMPDSLVCEARATLRVNGRNYDLRVELPQELYRQRDISKITEAIVQKMAPVIATDLMLAWMGERVR